IFMVTPESITGATVATIAGDATQRALDKYAVGGIVYSDKNISNKDQFTTLIEKTSAMVKYPTFFAFTEEGGDMGALAKAGYYDAVIIELGEGVGDNWWCIMYPPLCFVNKNENAIQIKYKSKLVEWFKNMFN
ncbi:MAG: stage II sporulation protein R, partial [Clostridia bacterium]|nr:stage II sporulation protein R [Clostridia bacterium]